MYQHPYATILRPRKAVLEVELWACNNCPHSRFVNQSNAPIVRQGYQQYHHSCEQNGSTTGRKLRCMEEA